MKNKKALLSALTLMAIIGMSGCASDTSSNSSQIVSSSQASTATSTSEATSSSVSTSSAVSSVQEASSVIQASEVSSQQETSSQVSETTSSDVFSSQTTASESSLESISSIDASSVSEASASSSISEANPKAEETMDIISDNKDFANVANINWSEPTNSCVSETVNTYGSSQTGLVWTGAQSGNGVFFTLKTTDAFTVTSTSYIEFFSKNINHTTSANGETKNGLFVTLYDANGSKLGGTDVKVYKSYNLDCQKDAGNGWTYTKLPLSLFSTTGSFVSMKIKVYANMNANEAFYIDGINVVAPNSTDVPPEENPTIDHSLETLPICAESKDLFNNKTVHWINGTHSTDTENHYGSSNSTTCLAWKEAQNGENMMLYINEDKTTSTTITETGYVEFFIKDVGHTSSSEARASGVWVRLYLGSDKVAGVLDVKCYKSYNAECRQDAGNGWSYYKLPLTLFGTVGASFDAIRLSTNTAFDSGEVMYLDGLQIVNN